MREFSICKRTSLTEDALLAAFVRSVEAPANPPAESDGIEGTAEGYVMRWRERHYSQDSDGRGVIFGPHCEARVTKSDGVLTIRCTIATSALFWLVPIAAAVAFLTLFAAVKFISPDDWRGPRWVAWLLPACAALFLAKPFWGLRRTSREARAFLERLVDDTGTGKRRAPRA